MASPPSRPAASISSSRWVEQFMGGAFWILDGLPNTALPDEGEDELSVITQQKQSTSAKPQRISFMDLSPELRNAIYEHSIKSQNELIVASPFIDDLMSLGAQPSLSRSNRQIRSETLKMFYKENTFVAYIQNWDFSSLIGFIRAITSGSKPPDITIHVKLMDRINCAYDLVPFVRAWRDVKHETIYLLIHNCYMRPTERIEGFDQRSLVVTAADIAEGLRKADEFSEQALLEECHIRMEKSDRQFLRSKADRRNDSCAFSDGVTSLMNHT